MRKSGKILVAFVCAVILSLVFVTAASASITSPTYQTPTAPTKLWSYELSNGVFPVAGKFYTSNGIVGTAVLDGDNYYANTTNWVDGAMVEHTTSNQMGNLTNAYTSIIGGSYFVFTFDIMADKYSDGEKLITIDEYNLLSESDKEAYTPSFATTDFMFEMPKVVDNKHLWIKQFDGRWYLTDHDATSGSNKLLLPDEAGVWTNISLIIKTDLKVRYKVSGVEYTLPYTQYGKISDKSSHTDATVIVNSDVAVYKNGEYAFDYNPWDLNGVEYPYSSYTSSEGGLFKYCQIKAGTDTTSRLNTPMSVCYDNPSGYRYPEGYTGDFATAFENRSSLNVTTDSIFNQNYNKVGTTAASVTKEDGTVYGYYSVEQAYSALTDGDTLEILKSTDAVFTPREEQITSLLKVKTNGYRFTTPPGYGITSTIGGVYNISPVSTGYTVDGILYDSAEEAVRALKDGSSLNIYSSTDKEFTTDKAITIYKNGFNFPITYAPTTGTYSHFEIIDESGNVLKEVTCKQSYKIRTFMGEMKSGYTIRFLGDTVIDYPINFSGRKIYNLDFNGYDYVTKCASGTNSFEISGAATLNVTSSRPGTEIYNVSNASASTAVFLLKKTSNTLREAYLNIDGDNIKVFGACAIYSYDATGTVNVDGGSYYKTGKYGGGGLISVGHSQTINIRNADLIGISGVIFYITSAACEINIIDSDVYAHYNYIFYSRTIAEAVKINFIGSTIGSPFTGYASTHHYPRSIVMKNGTKLTSGAGVSAVFEEGAILAKTDAKSGFALLTPTFSCDEEGNLTAAIGCSGYEIGLYAESIIVTEGYYKEITWVNGTESITEYWDINATPVCPYEMPASTDVYKYEMTLTSKDGNKEVYEILPKANFEILMNLTLYTDFVYNVYVPKSLVDTKYITSKTVNGTKSSFSGAKSITINGSEYYVIEIGIIPAHAAADQTVVLEIVGKNNVKFNHTLTLSIPSYADKILDGNYSATTDNLMNTTLAYIKAATEYFGTSSVGIGSVTNAPALDGVELITPAEEIRNVISGATLAIDSTLKIVFNFTADAEGDVVFTYPVKGVMTDHKVTAVKGGTYEISLRARDLLTDVKVTVGEKTMTYGIKNYIYFVNSASFRELYPEMTDAKYSSLKTLLYNLYAYAEASRKYRSENNLTDITIGGNYLESYVIVATTQTERNAAAYIRTAIQNTTGILLPVVSSTNGPAFRFEKLTLPSSYYDYAVSVRGGDVILASYLDSFVDKANRRFATEYLASLYGEVKWSDGEYIATYCADTVYYSDFGAVGDGVTNDSIALHKTHDYANQRSYTVKADEGKTYYIHKLYYKEGSTAEQSIVVNTNVDWTGANIILDDTTLGGEDPTDVKSMNFIRVEATYPKMRIADSLVDTFFPGRTIDKDTITKVEGWDFGFPAMLRVTNDNHKNFCRYEGGKLSAGGSQSELIVIDEYGNIDPSTPFMFDYEDITVVAVFRIDEPTITIKGGKITSLASQINISSLTEKITYATRALSVYRSNVILDGVEHYVENERSTAYEAPACSGFFHFENAANILVENCVPTGHKYAKVAGTYDISIAGVNNIVFKNVIQSNYFKSEGVPANRGNTYWGVMGSNYCKNVVYDSCLLTRFDAHCGLYNGKIINSRVSSLELIGAGDFVIENTTIDPYSEGTLILLRSDYGSTWDGTITFKNVTVNNTQDTMTFFSATSVDLDFGYPRHLPNLIIDNITFTSSLKYAYIYSRSLTNNHDPENFVYPFYAPSFIKSINNTGGYQFRLHNDVFYSGTTTSGINLVS